MANIPITFDAGEQTTQYFERACADVGTSVSAGLNILMRVAIRKRELLNEADDSSSDGKLTFQQQQRKAVYDFIASNHADKEDELTADDYAEFDNGKYKLNFGNRDFDIDCNKY